MPRLSSNQLEVARTIAHRVFDWEVLSEEHAAVLRQNMNECAAAYEEVARATLSAFPPRDQWDRCIEELTRTLEPKAVTMVEYVILGFFRIFSRRHSSRVKAVATLLFVCRLSIMKAGEDTAMCLEMLRMKNKLQYVADLSR
jgi:diphthamide synthase (EF-2-diphthine--ammonia ligase)